MPVPHIKAAARKKSIFELCGTSATIAFSRFGNSPSIFQPNALNTNRPNHRVRKLPPRGSSLPKCHVMRSPPHFFNTVAEPEIIVSLQRNNETMLHDDHGATQHIKKPASLMSKAPHALISGLA